MPHIYVFCPDTNKPYGGIRKLYHHVDILNKHNFSAAIVHQKKNFKCTWFEHSTKIRYLADINFTRSDYIVIPETEALKLKPLFHGIKKVIFNQNAYYSFWHHSIEKQELETPYIDSDLVACLVVSEDNQKYLNYTFPHLDLLRIRYGINNNLFYYNLVKNAKKLKIAFMPRKNPDEINQVLNILKYRKILENYELVAIQNKTESEVAEILKESLIFLSFGYPEGFQLPPAEAMACGCLVIGYHGMGGQEFFKPEFCYPITQGDIIQFTKTVETVLLEYQKNPHFLQAKAEQASEFIKNNYSLIEEEKSIINCWHTIFQKKNEKKCPKKPYENDSVLSSKKNAVTLKTNSLNISKSSSEAKSSLGSKETFFSVMIPTYKPRLDYLKKTIESVLSQDIDLENIEIEVIDDCSPIELNLESFVQTIGQGKVSFYRQSKNVGIAANWNTCIKRARGEWIHILHQDDFVLPRFYKSLQAGTEQEPTVGAAFCRYIRLNEENGEEYLSKLERETPGVLSDWLQEITVHQRIQCPAIVVKRSVYEKLGGFHPELCYALDWEMWKRIAAHYPFWYEPEPLACWRMHDGSESDRLIRSGANIADIRRSIEISQAYLPQENLVHLSEQARKNWGMNAIVMANKMLQKGDLEAAIAQIREGLLCSQSSLVAETLTSLISAYLQGYQLNPFSQDELVYLRQIRQEIARQWLAQDTQALESAYQNALGQAHRLLCNSQLRYEPLTTREKYFVNDLLNQVKAGFKSEKAIQYFLAATLYCHAYQLPLQYQNAAIPAWLFKDFIAYLFQPVFYFGTLAETEQYCNYIADLIDYIHQNISRNKKIDFWQYVSQILIKHYSNNILYLSDKNCIQTHQKVSEIVEFGLQIQPTDFEDRVGKNSWESFSNRKIRVGILLKNFGASKETAIALPFFEYLDPEKFDVFLYALEVTAQPLELYCQRHAQRLLHLPEALRDQVSMIRADNLDMVLISSNLSDSTNPITLLAHHRLAHIQIANLLTPISSGIRNIDYYLAGKLTAPLPEAQVDFSEKLINLEGSGFCFSFPLEPKVTTVKPERQSWGATADSIVFISGANFHKITPALREAWSKILLAVPKSVLVLYPFGQHPNDFYPHRVFYHQMRSHLVASGLSPNQLTIIHSLKSRTDIKACLQQADIYLDAYPYTGAASMIDPLEVGIVPIVRTGNPLHTRQAGALLRELRLEYLITDSEDAYIERAIAIATNPQLRQQLRQQIQSQMQSPPSFLNSRRYAAKIGAVFEQLIQAQQADYQLH